MVYSLIQMMILKPLLMDQYAGLIQMTKENFQFIF